MKLLTVTTLASMVAAAACGGSLFALEIATEMTHTAEDLIELPDTDLTGVEDRIQVVLRDRRAVVTRLSGDPGASSDALARAYGELGRASMMYELVELTDVCFANATVLDPTNPDWHYFRGVVSQSLQRSEQAVAAFQRSLDLRAGDLPTTYRLAEMKLQLGRRKQARQLFEGVSKHRLWAAAGFYGLGRVEAAEKNWPAAIEQFEKALQDQAAVGEIQHQLGMAYREVGDLESARRFLALSDGAAGAEGAAGRLYYPDPLIEGLSAEFKRSSIYLGSKAYEEGRFQEAQEHYENAIRSDPTNPTYRQALATAFASLGDLDGAVRENREALQLAPGDAMAHVQLAGALLERDGPTEEVVGLYESAVELAPDLKEGLMGLAQAYSLGGRYVDALDLFARVLEIEPGDRGALYSRSQVLIALGSNQEAIVDLESILETDPHVLEAILDLASLLVRSGVIDEAVQLLEDSRSQEWEPAAEALLAFNAGVMWQQMGENDRALAAYEVAVENAPDFDDAHFNLAVLLGEQGEIDSAISHLQRVVELNPADREAHVALATALIQTGQFSDARAALEKSHRDLPQDVELTRSLVQILVGSPDPDVRDPEKAVPLALEVQQTDPGLENIGWVVAALAGSRRFDEAADWQIRLINAAEKAGLSDQELGRLRSELEQFRRLEDENR